ncbi:MAG: M14 family metallopeptidase [Chloroflexota bacterium]
MPNIKFDRFYRYADLTNLLLAFANEYPQLARITSIGKSHEGRDVWIMTLTNFQSGPDTEKPALWVDGNIHASELAASAANLYFIHSLLTRYGMDPAVTEALDTRVFYICPRVNPDGAEWALADRPKIIRSSTRPYPYDEEPIEGLLANEDIDGDGRILSMRIPDPNGAWKCHPEDPRLMIRRDPVESGGKYYRVLPEGPLKNYDGTTIKVQSPREGLDLNRNFPINWRQEVDQTGAGPYPVSEPEARNLVDFIVKHPNIGSAITFHTMSGVLLRPYDDRADEAFPAEDLWTYQKIGAQGTKMTGYPNVSIFHDFTYHPKQVTTGGFDTWMYDHLGMFAWTVEIWSPQNQAGIGQYKFIEWYREHPIEDDLLLMKWNDEKLGGTGFIDWYEFEHPQLGKVELGGWNSLHTWTNPPAAYLEKEIQRFPDWLVWNALISPRLSMRECNVTSIGSDTYRIRLVLENTGWLPTYITKKALEKKVIRGVLCEIELPEDATLQSGKQREEFVQLEGRAYKNATLDEFEESSTDRLKVEWVIHAPHGGSVALCARHDRAGLIRTKITLV